VALAVRRAEGGLAMLVRGTFALSGIALLAAIIAGPLMEPNMKARLLHLRLHSYYSRHAPSQLEKLDSLVEKYAGNEAPLLSKVEAKYGVPVPEVDVWQLHDPVGVGAYVAYTAVKAHAFDLAVHLEARFPHVRATLRAQLAELGERAAAVRGFASAPAQLVLAALAYVLLATRSGGARRCLSLAVVSAAVALVIRPTVEDVSPASLRAGAAELLALAEHEWTQLALAGRVGATTICALFGALTCGRHHKSFVLFAWALAALALLNPPLPPSASTLDAIAQLGVADGASVSLFRHTDESLFAVHDLTFCTVLTLSPAAAAGGALNEWAAPVLAVGIVDRWLLLSNVRASKTDETRVRIDLPGVALPVYFLPLTLGVMLLAAALLSNRA